MNKLNRKLYSERHVRRVKLFERQFTRPLYDEIRRPMLEVSQALKDHGLVEAMRLVEKIIIVQGVGPLIQNIYTEVGIWSGKKTLAEIRTSVREMKAGFGFNERWTEAILNYFRLFLLSKAVLPISQTTRQDILAVLNKGVVEGWGIDRMAFELERVDLPLSRARTIVRTEIAKAQFFGTELGKQESDYVMVERWIAARDPRTRHSHRLIDGTVIEQGQKFQVARYKKEVLIGYDMMIGPGDPDASPENIINCRCTKSVRAKRDENGRPIKKSSANSEISLTLT